MHIGTELRRLVSTAEDGAYERRRDGHRLTAVTNEAAPGEIGFTLSEARSRGWAPVVAGRISADDELTITYCSALTSTRSIELLFALLSEGSPLATVTPLPALSPVGLTA